jgi:hypothetical protein
VTLDWVEDIWDSIEIMATSWDPNHGAGAAPA